MVYDCFPFLNELDVLDIRLNVLDPVVDFFVLVESTHTFQRNKKPLYFEENQDRFKKFLPKIIHVIDDQMPLSGDTWITYRHQMNCIFRGLKNAHDDDVISVSDLDEIPNPSLLKNSSTIRPVIHPQQKVFYYFLNCFTGTDRWDSGFIAPYHILRGKDLHDIRMRTQIPGESIPNGGWHFSYMGGIDSIVEKLESFSHIEYNILSLKNKEFLATKLKTRVSLFDNTNTPMQIVPIDDSFPEYIRNNLSRYGEMGWIA